MNEFVGLWEEVGGRVLLCPNRPCFDEMRMLWANYRPGTSNSDNGRLGAGNAKQPTVENPRISMVVVEVVGGRGGGGGRRSREVGERRGGERLGRGSTAQPNTNHKPQAQSRHFKLSILGKKDGEGERVKNGVL